MTTALVCGAAGFLGQNIVKGLLKKGVNVIALDNFEFGKRESISEGVKIIEHDVNNWIDIPEDIDYIFHFAGPSSVIQFNNDPVKCVRTTLRGMSNVLWLARKKKCYSDLSFERNGI